MWSGMRMLPCSSRGRDSYCDCGPLIRFQHLARAGASCLVRGRARNGKITGFGAWMNAAGGAQQLDGDIVKRMFAIVDDGMGKSALGEPDFPILQRHLRLRFADSGIGDVRITQREDRKSVV